MGKEQRSAQKTIDTIRRKTRRKHSAEEKIRIVLEGLKGEETIAELCRREGIAQISMDNSCHLGHIYSQHSGRRVTNHKN